MSLRALVLTKDAAEYEICVNGFRFRLHGFKRRIGKTTERIGAGFPPGAGLPIPTSDNLMLPETAAS